MICAHAQFWSPAPADPHQHSCKLHTLSDTNRPVYGSLYGSIPDSLHTYLCFAYLLDSPAILQRIFQDSHISNYSPALIPTLLNIRTPLSCEREGYQFLHLHITIPTILTSSSLSYFTASHSIKIPMWYLPVVFWLSLWQCMCIHICE